MGIYLENGYANIEYFLGFKCPFTIVIGGRGTGKTYGALKYVIENHKKIILMRRTQSQTDLINKPEFSPINPVAHDMGIECTVKPISKYNSSITIGEDEIIGYTAALSTFSNLRGFDASSFCDIILYDEFIPETHERPLKNEGDALLNVYETVNRNRELKGGKPIQMLLLSNANRLDSPILESFGLIKTVERMRNGKQKEYINPTRGIAVFLLYDSPISAKKQNTALYNAVGDSAFSSMSLSNDFAFDDLAEVKSLPLTGWKLLAQVGKFYLYRQQDIFYISRHCAGTPKRIYEDTDIDKKRFVRENVTCFEKILAHKIYYEDFSCKTYLTSLFI